MPITRRSFSLAAWLVVGLSLLVSVTVLIQAIHRLRAPLRTDFGVFYVAGRLAAHGHWLQVYNTAKLNGVETALGEHPLHLFYPYPPYVTLMLSAFGRLPPATAFAAWTSLNVLALVVAAILILRLTESKGRLLGVGCFLACLPMIVSSAQGENGGLIALGFTLTLLAVAGPATDARIRLATRAGTVTLTGSTVMLATGIGLLALKPQFLVVPLVVVLARHRRPELLTAGLILAGVGAAGLAAGGFDAYQRFVVLLASGLRAGTKYHWGPSFNYTFQAQVQAVFGRGLPSTILFATLCLSAIVVVVLVTTRTTERSTPEVQWLVISAVAVLATTHAMYHDLVLLYPAVVISLGIPRMRWAAIALLTAIMFDPVLYPGLHLHVIILALTATVAVGASGVASRLTRTMDGYRLGVYRTRIWKLFAPPRWGSASGSETPSR